MNTIMPAFAKFRALCLSKLKARGWVRPPSRRREIQMEFPWR